MGSLAAFTPLGGLRQETALEGSPDGRQRVKERTEGETGSVCVDRLR
jgi:hypothetical protein